MHFTILSLALACLNNAEGRGLVQRVSNDPNAPIEYVLGQPTLTVATYPAGASLPVPGAPALPGPFVFDPSQWPDTPEVKEWMKELEGVTLPSFGPTVDGTCAADPAAAEDAANRGWWSCGGFTRDTDIVSCPEKGTWGVSFDDGPAEYSTTSRLHSLTVGSRVIQNPDILREEYMTGHEVSVHSWSHAKALTSMTNEEIVAELGWTRKAIKDVLGVTPTTMRPPLGDIDDRVRAISMAMGLVPIMWTASPSGATFDTNDWKVPGNLTTIDESFQVFDKILDEAADLDTGFIVLQHDQNEVTVSMAIDHTLNTALNRDPPFKLQKISECQKFEPGEFYRETSKTDFAPRKKLFSKLELKLPIRPNLNQHCPLRQTVLQLLAPGVISASASSSANPSTSAASSSSTSTSSSSPRNVPSTAEKVGQGEAAIQGQAADNGNANSAMVMLPSVGFVSVSFILSLLM
ncbi:hypothetical protein DL96DRAFT_1614723 [Flagelloscypha sp. PMI_526]|nr:hypothetical protein DL96DRAFT_1614723 [Flagelloscypha sp. PMI_526]